MLNKCFSPRFHQDVRGLVKLSARPSNDEIETLLNQHNLTAKPPAKYWWQRLGAMESVAYTWKHPHYGVSITEISGRKVKVRIYPTIEFTPYNPDYYYCIKADRGVEEVTRALYLPPQELELPYEPLSLPGKPGQYLGNVETFLIMLGWDEEFYFEETLITPVDMQEIVDIAQATLETAKSCQTI